jgi:hypothetical protein
MCLAGLNSTMGKAGNRAFPISLHCVMDSFYCTFSRLPLFGSLEKLISGHLVEA